MSYICKYWLLGLCRSGCWLDLMILKFFSNIDDSMILRSVPVGAGGCWWDVWFACRLLPRLTKLPCFPLCYWVCPIHGVMAVGGTSPEVPPHNLPCVAAYSCLLWQAENGVRGRCSIFLWYVGWASRMSPVTPGTMFHHLYVPDQLWLTLEAHGGPQWR